MTLLKDETDLNELLERQSRNLHEFKREKLMEMSERKKKPKRERVSIIELYDSDIEVIVSLVLKTIESYVKVDEIPLETARERALSDYMFWYNDDEKRQQALENIVYAKK